MIGVLIGFIVGQYISVYFLDTVTLGEAGIVSLQLILYSFVLFLCKKAKWFE